MPGKGWQSAPLFPSIRACWGDWRDLFSAVSVPWLLFESTAEGGGMASSLLERWYRQKPRPRSRESFHSWFRNHKKFIEQFQNQVTSRYQECTLQRLLSDGAPTARDAAAFCLGLLGTWDSNPHLAAALQDEDEGIRQMASEALWSLWFRAHEPRHTLELRRLVRLRDRRKALEGLSALVQEAPDFAEAWNQRAIIHFKSKRFEEAIADCERALKLNPHHFGAHAGMAQCYMHMRRHASALSAFRAAHQINPHMDGIVSTIKLLEKALDEEPSE